MEETRSGLSATQPPVTASAVMPLHPELKARLDAVREQEEHRNSLGERIKRERRVLVPILILCLLALPNFHMAKVQGHSMEPRYDTGDTLVLLRTFRWFSPLKVGDIIVVKLKHGPIKGEEIVKRVVFIQNAKGDAKWPKYNESSRGEIPLDYWFPQQYYQREPVPPGGIMVMGDNVMNSMDSRDFGPIYDYEIEGKVMNP